MEKNCQHILWTAPKYFKILLDKDHGPTTLKYVLTPLQDYSYTSERDVSIFTPVTGWCPNLKTAEMYVVTSLQPTNQEKGHDGERSLILSSRSLS